MKKRAGIIIISLMLTAMGSVQAGADEVYVFQQGLYGYSGCVDECIHESGYLSDTRLRMKASSASGEEYNTLIRFEGIEEDLAGKIIIGASLTLTFRYENVAWAPATIDVYPCLKWWNEPDWTYAEPFADPCVAWDIAGAQKPNKDRGGLILDPCPMGDRYWYSIYNYQNYDDGTPFEFPLDAALVQSWVNDPCSNLGVILTMNLGAVTDVTFSSSTDGTITERPKLTVTVGEGIVVPEVAGLPHLEAEEDITDAGLTLGGVTFTYSLTVPEDYVISQDPNAGTVLIPGEDDLIVYLVESLGSMVEVPAVVGLPHAEAEDAISVWLTMGEVEYMYDDLVPAGYVISQDPNAGSEATVWSEVNLVESRGEQPMPDFNGDYITNLVDFNQLASEWLSCDPEVVTTDMTADGCVQVDDLVFLVERWLQYHCKNRPEADIDGDCRVDMDDLAILLSEWLMCDDETTANLDGDGEGCVNLSDMSILSSQWGLCGEAYEP